MTTDFPELAGTGSNAMLKPSLNSDCPYCAALDFARCDSPTRFRRLDQLGLYCSAQLSQVQVERIENLISALATLTQNRHDRCPQGHTLSST
jgi:hypothetical protein